MKICIVPKSYLPLAIAGPEIMASKWGPGLFRISHAEAFWPSGTTPTSPSPWKAPTQEQNKETSGLGLGEQGFLNLEYLISMKPVMLCPDESRIPICKQKTFNLRMGLL